MTVTGQSPLVDVQSVQRQRVIGKDVIDAIPTGRTQFNTVALLPGITASVQDVGGTSSLNLGGNAMLTTHGGRNNDMRVMIDGLSTANAETSGNSSNFLPNMGSTQEISVDYAAGAAEQPTGGVRINMIPREGGNRFAGSFFGTAVNSSFQGSNFTQELNDRGLRTPDSIKLIYDLNPSARRSADEGPACGSSPRRAGTRPTTTSAPCSSTRTPAIRTPGPTCPIPIVRRTRT